MESNIEIKAHCHDYEGTEKRIQQMATTFIGEDSQTDTYFTTKRGRFKLRESSISGPYLIPYLRPDSNGPKKSLYQKITITDSDTAKLLFEQLFGIHLVVKKKRKIYMYQNVRIHLDQVEGLGNFIELEAVLPADDPDEPAQIIKVKYLMQQLGIAEQDQIATSYETMLQIREQ